MNLKRFLKNLKPVKYITLLRNYNKLETEYDALLEAVKEDCFQAIYSQINIPEQIQKKDRRIKQLEKKVKTLTDAIRIKEES